MADAASFIDHKRSNKRASFVILAGVFGLLFLVANLIVGVFGGYSKQECGVATRDIYGQISQDCQSSFSFNGVVLIMTILFVLGYLVLAWLFSASAALSMAKARPADGAEFSELRNIVEQMAIAAGIPVPAVFVVDDPAPNAFATGRNPKHAAITVTTGLLAVMSPRELRGVIAHETGHIVNRDIAVTTLAVLAVGAIALLAQIGIRIGFFSGGRRNEAAGAMMLVGIVLYLIAVPAGMLMRAALSRKREGMADATAVELTREPGGIRSALEKLEADTTVISSPSAASAHLWIESPLERGGSEGIQGAFGRLMDTHPPLAERIAILRAIEGLDPEGRGPNDPPLSPAVS